MEKTIRIVLYEDNRDLREGMTFLLQATPGIQLIGAFPDTSNLEMQVPGLKPDVVLMDIDMPGRSGIDATPVAKALRPETQVLMLTVFEEEDKIFQAIRNGASGYLLKRTSPTEIIAAIHDVHRGGSPMTSSIARRVLHFFQQEQPVTKTKDYDLSPRENDILKSLVKGYSYKLIAEEHFISIDTVRSHIRHIYEKLQVNSKTEAVLKALKEKIV
ncbi:MAG: response regulator transcription factor [Saprospiraceae bacterium]|nr:response regulator transcription factor [Saprospiraceae bacterium]MCF8249605.1 response regulator transcription factor [Saprospiraceae bacterium]MCF8280505.1 response regulator transcription factor [Bacteroidales bacterium]MCF8310437.1 response regulator transcription factor [Saprospiraceae bacterium]MCF8439815.1 response regulator transcription factor [Saprospiraceae bacterium]